MNEETERLWQLAKESHPDAVVFARNGDLYYLRGADVATLTQEFGLRCFGTTIGFDVHEAWYYMQKLAQHGRIVLRSERSGVSQVLANSERRKVPRPRGRFIAVDPGLVFEAAALMRMRTDEHAYDTFCELLLRNDLARIREYGEVYVFEFDGTYEVDWELTSMLPSRTLNLARAALDTRQKIPCRLVLPKAWRGRRQRKHSSTKPPEPVEFGQMRFNLD